MSGNFPLESLETFRRNHWKLSPEYALLATNMKNGKRYKNKGLFCGLRDERPAGIEPAPRAWEAHVLPLYYGRSIKL